MRLSTALQRVELPALQGHHPLHVLSCSRQMIGSDISDLGLSDLSQQKYDKPVQPILDSFPTGRHGKRLSAVMYSRYE